MPEYAFEDLLGGHSFTAASKKEPRTIKEMRKEIDAKDLDPDQLKVCAAQSSQVIILGVGTFF